MNILAAGATDTGRKRSNNEDSFLVKESVFAVADGMGGYEFGEMASRIAVTTLDNLYRMDCSSLNQENISSRLVSWAKEINQQIFRENQQNSSHMGTTLAAAVFLENRLYLLNIGDSRIYRISAEIGIEQITDDHSLVAEQLRLGIINEEEARRHPHRNVITRALGIFPDVSPDTFCCFPHQGDFYLICSDGLTGMLTDEDIMQCVTGNGSISEKTEKLICQANDAGGNDNITLIIIEVKND